MKTLDQLEDALGDSMRYLAETDDSHAFAKRDALRTKYIADKVLAAHFLTLEGTVAEKNAKAETSEAYSNAMEAYFMALQKFHELENRRDTAKIAIEANRTMSSNRRK